jgi:RNA polymerase sigma factor (TIGR02999 family)
LSATLPVPTRLRYDIREFSGVRFPTEKAKVTAIVAGLGGRSGRPRASAEQLMPLVYEELRRLARGYMARENRDHTLQPTALVHEAYLRLVDQSRVTWQGRSHFRAVGARVMRRILIDHARRRGGLKRGGDHQRVTLGDSLLRPPDPDVDLPELLTLNEALDKLARLDERQAQVVELRFFGGLTTAEIAETLGVSERTVGNDWKHGRAWLKRELSHR